MKLEEYLSTVTEQIRCQKARELVSGELKDHIMDQAEAYEADGMFGEEALEKAVQDMGDPVEVGVSLDRVHRPQMSVEMLVLVGIISILSIVVHAAFSGYYQDLQGAGAGYLTNQIFYVVCGYVLMLAIYRVDYSILAHYGKQIAAVFLLLILVGGRLCAVSVNGANLYIVLGPVRILVPTVMYLYAPLYGSVLYSYRGEGYTGIGKIFLWSAVPVWIALGIPSLNLAMVLTAVFAILFTVAVWHGWYRVNSKRVLVVLWTGMLAAPALLTGAALVTGNMADYQAARIHAWLSNDPEYDYVRTFAGKLLSSSHLLGRSEENMTLLGDLPKFYSEYIFVGITSAYGVLAGVLVATLLGFLVMKIFRISFRQRNQFGMVLGCSCGTVFLSQLLLCLAVNLGVFPNTSTVLPLFSSGGSEIIISYMLLGLVLSVYRYKNILKEERPVGKNVRTASP